MVSGLETRYFLWSFRFSIWMHGRRLRGLAKDIRQLDAKVSGLECGYDPLHKQPKTLWPIIAQFTSDWLISGYEWRNFAALFDADFIQKLTIDLRYNPYSLAVRTQELLALRPPSSTVRNIYTGLQQSALHLHILRLDSVRKTAPLLLR